ncbi:MAG: hypothetical protein M3256_12310 [Actinomycetota bacterium]|nr:hypothetical protein [Actinomycetota bacterium]
MSSKVIASKDGLILVAGIDEPFAVRTGGDVAGDTRLHHDGGHRPGYLVSGHRTYTDLVVRRGLKPDRDWELIRLMLTRVLDWETTVSQSPTDANGLVVGSPIVWTCLLKGVNPSESDANSADPSMFQLTFAVSGVA